MAAGTGTARYGTVDYRQAAVAAAQKYGLDPRIFTNQIQQESGFNPTARSPAGAQGIAQIMPQTARSWGVNPLDPIAALDAAARNMSRYVKSYGGSYEDALEAYNAGPGNVVRGPGQKYAETRNYVKRILGSGGQPVTAPQTGYPQEQSGVVIPDPVSVRLPAPPSPGRFSVNQRLEGALQAGAGVAAPVFGRTIVKAGAPIPVTPQAQDAYRTLPYQPYQAGGGQLVGAPVDRKGVATKPAILNFARQVAGIYGLPIKLGTGTNHNRMTTSGNVSAHWEGNALDLPATGEQLMRMGQAALIAAGADPAWARKQRKGLFNIGGYQIIFGTTGAALGGNHTDHLHVGIRG